MCRNVLGRKRWYLPVAVIALLLWWGWSTWGLLLTDVYHEGKSVRLISSIAVPEVIDNFAANEETERLFVVTAKRIYAYTYPDLRHVRSRLFEAARLIGLLKTVLVVANSNGDVFLLDQETLETIDRYPGRTRKVALDYRTSTLVMLHESNGLTFITLAEKVIFSSRTVPFSDATSVIAMAIVSPDSVVYSTNKHNGLYLLPSSHASPKSLPGSPANSVSTLIKTESESTLIAHSNADGAFHLFDSESVKQTQSFFVYSTLTSHNERVMKIDKASKFHVALTTTSHVQFPVVKMRYSEKRNLFVITDPIPKRGHILFVDADSLAVLDSISVSAGLFTNMYLSIDGNQLLTGNGHVIRRWRIPVFYPNH